jgi:DNA-directed RNA polymerase II subunit RPB1
MAYLESINNNIEIALIKNIKFSILTDEITEKISHVVVTKPQLFINNEPTEYGCHDGHMGSYEDDILCKTCNFNKKGCLGHSGSFRLKYPVIRPFFYNFLRKILKIFCYYCSKPIMARTILRNLNNLIEDKELLINKVFELKNIDKCVHCKKDVLKLIKNNNKDLFIYYYLGGDVNNKKILYTHLLENYLNKITYEDITLIGLNEGNHPKHIIQYVFYVTMNQIRPDSKQIANEKISSDQITSYIQLIIRTNDNIIPVPKDAQEITSENLDKIKYLNMFIYSLLMGSTINQKMTHNDFKPIVERLRTKDGIIRHNILGRRIHGMGRSVIVCDPTIPLDSIKIPMLFAKTIQLKETVNDFNKEILMQYVRNGTKSHPGASKITKIRNGKTYSLFFAKNIILENGDIVHRDLVDGDVVYFNRQPTLLYSGITAVKVLIDRDLSGNVISFNVAVAHYYNADYDGDQMSVIPLDSIICKFEAMTMASIAEFSISKKTGLSDIGQTYDTIIGCFLTSREKTKINKLQALRILSDVINIDNNILVEELDKLFKNNEYVKGNDLFSLVLPKINFKNTPSWYDSKFDKNYSQYEKEVIIKNGKIISGVLDKNSVNIGAKNSLYRVIQHEYNNKIACDTVFNMQQIAINYTLIEGFSISIKDLVISNDVLKEIRTTKMNERLNDLNDLIVKLKTGNLIAPVGYNLKDYFEDIFSNKAEMGLIDVANYVDFEKNQLFQLIQSGSKGKKSVMFQMLGTIGMQKIRGKLIDTKFSYQRTLPFYQRYDISPEARGFIKNSYLLGMSGPEFIVNSMQCRYDLINVALMTAVTGDQNRKSTKNFESIVVNNTRLIKNTTKILQMLYGNDSFDVGKSIMLSLEKHLNISDNEFKEKFYNTEFKEEYDILLKYKHTMEKLAYQYQYYQSMTNKFNDIYKISSPINVELIIINILTYNSHKIKNDKVNMKDLLKKIDEFSLNLPYLYFNKSLEKNKTELPECYKYGMYMIELQIKLFLSSNNLIKNKINKELLELILNDIEFKLIRALIQPGIPIGILTAQFISEPLTQSSLDTKHGAAQEDKKGGIGRIKEILSVKASSKIPDLQMQIHLKPQYASDLEMNNYICTRLEMLKLEMFVQKFQIFYEEPLKPTHSKYKSEEAFIKKFIMINKGINIPKNLSKFCIRIEINKEILFSKNLELKEIIYVLTKELKNDLIIYNNENKEDIIIRIYVSEYNIDKKIKNNLNSLINHFKKILQINIRGINNIEYAKVKTINNIKKYNDKGELVSNKEEYVIVTKGINMYELLLIDEIDETKIQIDDINLYLEMFGIESTKTKLTYELKDLIDENLNPKHYELTADNMTLTGILTSFEKAGLNKREKNNVLLRLSTSHGRQVLEESVINNIEASTDGLSPSLLVGKSPDNFGSSMNSIYIDHHYLENLYKSNIDKY